MCRARCYHSRHRWCPAQWPLAETALWGPVEACTWVQGSTLQLVEKALPQVGCRAGCPLNDSTSWSYELQKRKHGQTCEEELGHTSREKVNKRQAIVTTQEHHVWYYQRS